MPTQNATRGAVVVIALALLAGACGDDGAGEVSTDRPETTTATEAAGAPTAADPPTPTTTADPTTSAEASRAPAAELVAATELLVDGVTALPDVALPPPLAPGRYHSSRLGTEVVFDLPFEATLGQHRAGSIAFDDGPDRVLFISRYGDDEPLTFDEWLTELLESGWDVREAAWPDTSGNPVRAFDVTATTPQRSIGGVQAQGALVVTEGTTHRIWAVDQPDGHPIVIGTGLPDDEWARLADEIVRSLELGAAIDDPRRGRAPIEYGAPFWSIDAGSSYRTLLFGSSVLVAPDDIDGAAAGQSLTLGVPGDVDGLTNPGAMIAAPSGFADAAAMTDVLVSLSEEGSISALRSVDRGISIRGSAAETVEFDVPGGGEVLLFTPEPDGWSHLEVVTLRPATTYRVSVADVEGRAAVAMAWADVGFPADLDGASRLLADVLDGLG